MTIYYIFIILVFIFTYFSQISDRIVEVEGIGKKEYEHSTVSTFWFFLIVATMVLIGGLRFKVGTDYGAYYYFYEDFARDFWQKLKEYNEPGFSLICWIVVKFGGDGAAVVFVAALITYGVSMFSLYKKTHYVLMFTLLYVFLGCWHEGFNAVRQCLAGAFIVLGMNSLREKKFFRYLLWVIIAGAFHRSALIMIVLYFLVHRKINFRNIAITLVACVVVILSFDNLFEFSEALLEANYSLEYGYITSSVNIFRILVAVAPSVFFLYFYKNIGFDEENTFYMNLLISHSAIMIATSNSTFFARMGIYTSPFVAVAFPELFKVVDMSKRRIITAAIMVLYFAYWLYDISINPSLNVFQFIWQAPQ
jgi:hypothetical protein